MTHPTGWLIYKAGRGYYRPNAQGYTNDPAEAGRYDYPGRGIKLLWDGGNMKITNFDEANQFVKRSYRNGWSLGM
jgi:hypothetical protein